MWIDLQLFVLMIELELIFVIGLMDSTQPGLTSSIRSLLIHYFYNLFFLFISRIPLTIILKKPTLWTFFLTELFSQYSIPTVNDLLFLALILIPWIKDGTKINTFLIKFFQSCDDRINCKWDAFLSISAIEFRKP